jgi:hypothetical protein
MNRLLALWSVAVALAGFGTAVLFDAVPGLNWSLWILAAVGGILLCARLDGSPIRAPLLAPLGFAAGFGVAAAITAAPAGHAVIAGGVAALLAIAVLLAADPRWERLTAGLVLAAPVTAPLRSILEAIRRVCELVDLVGTARYRSPLRGALLAVPVVGLFALILANADPVLAILRDDLAEALVRLEFLPRLLFFWILLTASLGGCGLALQTAGTRTPPPAEQVQTPRLGDTERLVILGSVVVLFTTFLLLQLSYIFGNAPITRGSGVTFAEYARRGFAELTTVASLTTLLLVALDRSAARGGPRERWTRALAAVVVIEVEVLLLSALRRLWLYESAYGFTTVRLYAHAYMIGIALFLALLGWGLWRGLRPGWLARRGAGIAALAMTILLYWNHEAWIVRRNVGRFVGTGQLDTSYLVWSLSPNAAPTLVATLAELPPPQAGLVRDGLRQRYGRVAGSAGCRWFEWNRGRERAVAALRAGGLVRGDVQLDPRDCAVRSPS